MPTSTAVPYLVVQSLALTLLVISCDPGQTFRFENKTNELLFIEVNGGGRDDLPPETTRRYGVFEDELGDDDDSLRLILTDERGCLILERETTLRNSKEEDLTLVVRPEDLPPVQDRTNCDEAST